MGSEPKDKPETEASGSSLWTTPADSSAAIEATLDPDVTDDDIRRAIESARERAAAFDERERRRRGLRELSQLTQEFGGYDAELWIFADVNKAGGKDGFRS